MPFIQNLPIKRKLALIVTLTSFIGLLIANLILYAYDKKIHKEEMVEALSVLAQVISDRSTAALVFNDPKTAKENLVALRAEPSITTACIYSESNTLFAAYTRGQFDKTLVDEGLCPANPSGEGHRFTDNNLHLFQDILLDGERIGTIYILADLQEINAHLLQDMLILIFISLLAILIAFLFSVKLQRLISDPISHLADATRLVADQKDYSVRAEKGGQDELGLLTDGFNTMLEKIEEEQTSRDKVEIALRESEERFRQLAENITAVFWMTEPEKNKMIYISPAYEGIWGRSREKLYASPRTWLEAIHPDDRDRVLEAAIIQQALGTYEEEYRIVRPDGTVRIILDRAFPIRNQKGKVYRIAGIAEDITQRKEVEKKLREYSENLEQRVQDRTRELLEKTEKLEDSREALTSLLEDVNQSRMELDKANQKLKELDHLKSMFIASMSHELRTPLNAIIGFTGIILQGMSGEINRDQKDQLKRVYSSALHLLELITEIIDISKIEAGKLEPYLTSFPLDGLIKEAVSSLKTQMEEKGLAIETDIPTNIQLTNDRTRLLQCLLNYLSNAMKFTQEGQISVTAKEVNNMLEISVKDTGIGIEAADLPKLFTPFTRFVPASKPALLGTGLGLYLTKKLCNEVLGGEVAVESEFGKGSTFILKVPKDGTVGPHPTNV